MPSPLQIAIRIPLFAAFVKEKSAMYGALPRRLRRGQAASLSCALDLSRKTIKAEAEEVSELRSSAQMASYRQLKVLLFPRTAPSARSGNQTKIAPAGEPARAKTAPLTDSKAETRRISGFGRKEIPRLCIWLILSKGGFTVTDSQGLSPCSTVCGRHMIYFLPSIAYFSGFVNR